MKYRFWDNENKCWFKPVYQADKGQLEELLVTQSGELCLRKLEGEEVRYTHEALFPDRFKKCLYTGAKDTEGVKLYEGDILSSNMNGEKYLIKFGEYWFDEYGHTGFYLEYLTGDKVGKTEYFNKQTHKFMLKIGTMFELPQLLPGYVPPVSAEEKINDKISQTYKRE